jgi:ABC-type dipeptide/oligopeptide/nickel transport system permease component
MKLWQFVVRRLLLLVPVLLGVTLITFALINASGDPCRAYVRSEKMTQQQVDEARVRHGCNEPVHIRYALYMENLFRGDVGVTALQNPVGDELSVFFPATIELAMFAMVFAILAAIPLGVISATRKDTAADHLSRTFALSGVSIPIFWFALLLQMLMFVLARSGFPALPISGRFDATLPITHPFLENRSLQPTGLLIIDSLLLGDYTVFWNLLAHIILPAIALAYLSMAIITRMMRSSMLEVMRQDFVLTARSKGLSERDVIRKHARRNAMIPTVTVIGLSFGALLAGAVLTETVFAWPGVGTWSTKAILSGDTAVIMAFATVISLVYVFANLIVDVLYAYLDPRIRLE